MFARLETKNSTPIFSMKPDFWVLFLKATIKIDTVAPTVTITLPTGPYLLGQPGLSATWTATDATPGSGLVTPSTGTIPLDTSSVGTGKTATAPASTAVDNAGNPSVTVTETYSVIYGFKLLEPASLSKESKAGSTIPLKWQYTDYAGKVVNSATANPSITINGSEVTSPGKSGLQYDSLTNTWQVNWQTKGLAAGTYNVSIISGQTDQTNSFSIQLR